MNSGIHRAIDIQLRPDSIVWALKPSPVSGLAATTFEAVVSAAQMALGVTTPAKAFGMPYSIVNTLFGDHDTRPGFDAPFLSYVWSFGGLGGCLDHDGASVVGSIYLASTRTIPIELQERRYPLLWEKFGFKEGSGGPGKFRGGLGCYHVMTLPYSDGTLTVIGDAERFGPPGVMGGSPGDVAGMILNAGTEKEKHVGVFAVLAPMKRHDLYHYWTAGGGGYGDPLERDRELVLEDVIDELVSVDRAETEYGCSDQGNR